MPRHLIILWAANWVGPGRKRKSTQPGASGVIELAPFEFLDRLADLIPQRLRADASKHLLQRGKAGDPGTAFWNGRREQPAHEPLISAVLVEEVSLTGLPVTP
jgi:hypothetical protein